MVSIEEYAKEGWRARIKTVKGRKYITIRLRGKDKSLGPYTEKLWKECVQLGMVKKDPGDVEALKRTVEELSQRLNETSMLLEEKGILLEKLRKTSGNDHRALLACQKSITQCQKDCESPLSGLYSNFKCRNCRSEKFVAAFIKCTKCDTTATWGWQFNKLEVKK